MLIFVDPVFCAISCESDIFTPNRQKNPKEKEICGDFFRKIVDEKAKI